MTVSDRRPVVVGTRRRPDRPLAMLVHDNEVAPLEQVGVVEVKGAPEAPLPVHELIGIAIAFQPGTRDGLEPLAQYEGRSSRLAAVGERPDDLEAQRAVVSLEEVYGLVKARLGEDDPEALEERCKPRHVVVDLLD
jgi:hypothetical protein